MKKIIVLMFICCTLLTDAFASRPNDPYQERIALENLLEAQKILWGNKDKTDPLLYATLDSTFKEMDACLKKEKDWAFIFLCGTNIMLPVCTETLSCKVGGYTGKSLQYDREAMQKIYQCFFKAFNISGGKTDSRIAYEDTSDEIEFPVCCVKNIQMFTDIGDNEVDDRMYDCYKRYLMERRDRLISEGMEHRYKAEVLLEAMPQFNGKEIAKCVTAGVFGSMTVPELRMKCTIFVVTFLGGLTHNCIDRIYFHIEKMDEIEECYEKALECFSQADNIQDWLWNN